MNTYDTIARAVRIEIDPLTGDVYLVFKVIDETFKRNVRENWEQDFELKILGRDLVK